MPPAWDVQSRDYLLLGCFLLWTLALSVEEAVNGLKPTGEPRTQLFELDAIGERIILQMGALLAEPD
jgi:hypothetical protein